MAIEIERKFLVKDLEAALRFTTDNHPRRDLSYQLTQGYLYDRDGVALRVRTSVPSDGDCACDAEITCKVQLDGLRELERIEIEDDLPFHLAVKLLERCEHKLEKTRHIVVRHHSDGTYDRWEVDVYQGENEGLVVAEIELDRPDQDVSLPPWIGEEVTKYKRYSNSSLARHPFKSWGRIPTTDEMMSVQPMTAPTNLKVETLHTKPKLKRIEDYDGNVAGEVVE